MFNTIIRMKRFQGRTKQDSVFSLPFSFIIFENVKTLFSLFLKNVFYLKSLSPFV